MNNFEHSKQGCIGGKAHLIEQGFKGNWMIRGGCCLKRASFPAFEEGAYSFF